MKLTKLTDFPLSEINQLLLAGLSPIEVKLAWLGSDGLNRILDTWDADGYQEIFDKYKPGDKVPEEYRQWLQNLFGAPSLTARKQSAWIFSNPGRTAHLVLDTGIIRRDCPTVSSQRNDHNISSMLHDFIDTLRDHNTKKTR